MSVEMGDAFKSTIETISKDKNVRATILTGEGRAFSAGGDVEFLRARMADTPVNNAREMMKFYKRFLCLRDLQVPIIAAINGHAIGAGFCVALACDQRIAATDSKIGLTFTKLGLHPGMGATHFLPQVTHPDNASRLLLTGEIVNAKEALELGIVGALAEDPLEAAMKRAQQIASAGPIAVQTCMRSLRKQMSRGLEDSLWREADAQAQCYNSADMQEGVSAIVEKRAPSF